ncbi:STAS domain-containing protein [Kitasatospora nipponensis]|uniref:Anti-sigma factor antagonist n=1 Tax=Kitasatospora nipponensis TaxID=258049 RepID=A0ABN1WG87_9ACTN
MNDAQGAVRLSVALEARADSRVLRLTGELDHDTAQVLREALEGCLSHGPHRILVDFAGVGFCDSTGLNVLLRARQEALAADRQVELCALGVQVARLFEVTGVDGVFAIHPTVDRALAAHR